jgi:hypothetical protein
MPIDVEFPDPILRGLDQVSESLFRLPHGPAAFGLAQRAGNRRCQARQIAFEHVIGHPALQGFDGAFLAQSTRQYDERNFRRFGARDAQRRHAIELRQRKIRNDQVRRRCEPEAKRPFGVHARENTAHTGALQLAGGEFGFRFLILDEQNRE